MAPRSAHPPRGTIYPRLTDDAFERIKARRSQGMQVKALAKIAWPCDDGERHVLPVSVLGDYFDGDRTPAQAKHQKYDPWHRMMLGLTDMDKD